MQIHYFQRYNTKENVDTSNTMLMLSRLYNYSPDKFFTMLNEHFFETSDTPEVIFNLQEVGKNSVADAVISQKSFKIVVETKLKNQFDEVQLMNHLDTFGAEEFKVLLTIDPRPMDKNFRESFEKKVVLYNKEHQARLITPIKHCNITFEKLVNIMTDVVDSRDVEMVSILQDYSCYCFDQDLIPDEYRWMRAIVAGTTLQDNRDLSLYYDKKSRRCTDHGYIGLYQQKSIRAIGKLVKIVTAVKNDGAFVYEVEKGSPITDEEKERIQEAIRRSEAYGYNLKTESHRYFMVDKFYDIDFRKDSPYPIQKSKYFNLGKMLGYDEMPKTELIAKELDGKTWEEFQE